MLYAILLCLSQMALSSVWVIRSQLWVHMDSAKFCPDSKKEMRIRKGLQESKQDHAHKIRIYLFTLEIPRFSFLIWQKIVTGSNTENSPSLPFIYFSPSVYRLHQWWQRELAWLWSSGLWAIWCEEAAGRVYTHAIPGPHSSRTFHWAFPHLPSKRVRDDCPNLL